jgi:hypothetical protein
MIPFALIIPVLAYYLKPERVPKFAEKLREVRDMIDLALATVEAPKE